MVAAPHLAAPELVAAFRETGVIRLPGAFSAQAAARMRQTVGRHLAGQGIDLDDRATWPVGRGGWSSAAIRRRPVFSPLFDNPSVQAALDAVLGPGVGALKPGAQLLVSFPEPGPWRLPTGWHMDCGFEQPTWPPFAVKLFGFFDRVEPEGGGTLLLAGSTDWSTGTADPFPSRWAATAPPGGGSCVRTPGSPRWLAAGPPRCPGGTRWGPPGSWTASPSSWWSSPATRATWW